VSWFQPEPQPSLDLIAELAVAASTPIVDAGGGASLLAARLLAAGFNDVTVADLSSVALAELAARSPAAVATGALKLVEADIRSWVPERAFGVWHDRAAFHFLTDEVEQRRYLAVVHDHVAPGGFLIIATFAEDGPTKCSGLPVCHYTPAALTAAVAAAGFTVVKMLRHVHHTPSGGEQPFSWVVARRGV